MPITLGNLKLYSVDELAERLRVTKLTIRTYCRQGRLRARKVGNRWYVSEESLSDYFNRPVKGAAASTASIWD